MTGVWSLAALWLGLALLATLLSIWLGVATALSEIVVGTVAQLLIGAFVGSTLLGTDEPWIRFLSGTGAIILTFLSGAELDPGVFRAKWKETTGIGLVAFFTPFLGCAAFEFYGLEWAPGASWLAGVALSTTSVAVVYAVMLELPSPHVRRGRTPPGPSRAGQVERQLGFDAPRGLIGEADPRVVEIAFARDARARKLPPQTAP